MSNLSLNSEDWDCSGSDIILPQTPQLQAPRNSIQFPGESAPSQDDCTTPGANGGGKGRSLSELMRLHAEKGTDVTEEATRVANVLKQWVGLYIGDRVFEPLMMSWQINSGTSPYEGEDDFFSRANDDSSLGMKRTSQSGDASGRQRGQSESTISR